MTNAELVTRILQRLGNRSSAELRDYAVLEVQTKIQEYELGPVLPWFLETEATLTTAAGTESVSLPADFLREVEDGALIIYDPAGDYEELRKLSLDRIRREVKGEENGFPKAYAILGDKIYLAPVPDAIYTLKLSYFKKSPAFTDSADPTTYWCKEASNLVIFGAAAQIAAVHILNAELATALVTLEKRALDALYVATEARINTNQDFNIED